MRLPTNTQLVLCDCEMFQVLVLRNASRWEVTDWWWDGGVEVVKVICGVWEWWQPGEGGLGCQVESGAVVVWSAMVAAVIPPGNPPANQPTVLKYSPSYRSACSASLALYTLSSLSAILVTGLSCCTVICYHCCCRAPAWSSSVLRHSAVGCRTGSIRARGHLTPVLASHWLAGGILACHWYSGGK